MDIYSKYKQDKELEAEGIEFQVGKSVFVIRRYDIAVPAVRALYEKAIKPYSKRIQAGVISNEEAEVIERELFVKTSLVKWENVCDREGNEIPFSVEAAIKLFTELPELEKDLKAHSTDRENYKESLGEA